MEVVQRISNCVFKTKFIVLRAKYSTKCDGLLSDISVLDLSRVIAGPFCTMTLGDLGANVIKVESLDGDEARKWGPPFIKDSSDSYYFLSVNRNKKSICIDFKRTEGKYIFMITYNHTLFKKAILDCMVIFHLVLVKQFINMLL